MGKSREEFWDGASSKKRNLQNLIIELTTLLQRGYMSRSSPVVPSLDMLIEEILHVKSLFVAPPRSNYYPQGSQDQFPWLWDEKTPEISFGEDVWSDYYETMVPDSDALGNPRQITTRFMNRRVHPDRRLVHYFDEIASEIVQLKRILSSKDYASKLTQFFQEPNDKSRRNKFWATRRRAR